MNTAQERLADDQEFLASLTDRSGFSSFLPISPYSSISSFLPPLSSPFVRPLYDPSILLAEESTADSQRSVANILSALRRRSTHCQARSSKVREEEGGVREAQHAPLPGGGGDR